MNDIDYKKLLEKCLKIIGFDLKYDKEHRIWYAADKNGSYALEHNARYYGSTPHVFFRYSIYYSPETFLNHLMNSILDFSHNE